MAYVAIRHGRVGSRARRSTGGEVLTHTIGQTSAYSRTDFRPRRNSTSVGDMRGFSSECPSRPYSGEPHVYTSPLSEST